MNAKEVLFIGTRIDNWELVEGFYYSGFKDLSQAYILCCETGIVYEVYTNSVHQFTGKLDIKGKRVYGSHICRYGQNFERMGKVEWRNFGWYIGDLSIADTELEIISF